MTTTDTLSTIANRLAAHIADTIGRCADSPDAYRYATAAYRRAADIVIAVNTLPLPAYVYGCMDSLHHVITDLADFVDVDEVCADWVALDEALPQ